MKKLLSLFVAVVFVAGMAGVAAAQSGGGAAPEKKMEKSGDKMSGEKMEKKMSAKNANGTVKSAAAGSIVVAGKEKGKEAEWTFAVDSSTKIKKDGKDIMAGDLKAGDRVHVSYTEKDGNTTAQSVKVTGGGMAKKSEKMEKSDAKNPCAAKK